MGNSVRLSACAIVAAGLLAACGKGTPLTAGTATPPPPFTPKVTSEFPVPTKGSKPMGIALGADSSLWFTEFGVSKIGNLTTGGVVATPEPLTPTKGAGPNQIASGPNSLLWFTETNAGNVGQITLVAPPVITEFALKTPSPNSSPDAPTPPPAKPVGIALGSDGNMWVTDDFYNGIWKIGQSGVLAGECPAGGLGRNSVPLGITNGPDGALWFTEQGANRIGRIPIAASNACGTVTQFHIPTRNSGPASIVAGTDNALWFTEKNARKLARMDVSGHVTNEYSLAPAKTPNGLLQGADGNFYFTDTAGNSIGQFLVTTHKVTLFSIPTSNSGPTALSPGPENPPQIYFVESTGNKIGQFKYHCC